MNENLENESLSLDYPIEDQKLVTITQYMLLSIATFGLYTVWWMYKEWRFFRDKEYLDIYPAVRAIFSVFFIYSLSQRILDYAKSLGYTKTYDPLLILFVVIFSNIASIFPDPYGLISIVFFFVLIPVVNASNFAKLQDGSFNCGYQSSFSGKQFILLIAGGIFWVLIIIGLLFGDPNEVI